jgi:AcrR family transcriptional regulator
VGTDTTGHSRRSYELGKRLEQMDRSRAAILRAARAQLEEQGYRRMTMGSLATESGVTRQTVHNLFGTKTAVLEALFDAIALDAGMDGMRDAMTQPSRDAMLERFVQVFSRFWASNRVLLRRVHGIAAIDPELGAVLQARNQRRLTAANRIVGRFSIRQQAVQKAAALSALTSFEFFDALSGDSLNEEQASAQVLDLARKLLAGA